MGHFNNLFEKALATPRQSKKAALHRSGHRGYRQTF